MDLEKLFQSKPLQKWLKIIGGSIAAIWIIREIFMMIAFTSMFNFVTGGIKDQEQSMKEMHKKSDAFMDEMSHGEEDVVKGMTDGMEHMVHQLDKLKKDFERAGPIEEEVRHNVEHVIKESKDYDRMMHEEFVESERREKEEEKKFWEDAKKRDEAMAKENEKTQKIKDKEARTQYDKERQAFYNKSHFLAPDYDHSHDKE